MIASKWPCIYQEIHKLELWDMEVIGFLQAGCQFLHWHDVLWNIFFIFLMLSQVDTKDTWAHHNFLLPYKDRGLVHNIKVSWVTPA